ncbi:MAG: glutamine--fructose-6-phosphate transaminase (isomerizing) [Halanaerobiales bacterium]
MCGIVGYIGEKKVTPILIEGLKKLEYRGYDSAGIVTLTENQKIEMVKKEGKLEELKSNIEQNLPAGNTGIAHTRWATHGKPSDVNAHPHQDCEGEFVVVHNGIIENYQDLKKDLIEKGHSFKSETDTEVIPHLIEEYYKENIKETLIDIIPRLEGSFALGVLSRKDPGRILVVRQDSPLIIGQGKNENYVASDIPAFLNYTDQFYILDDGEMAEVTADSINIFNENGKEINKEIFEVSWDSEMAEKKGYDHYMIKEINEQPDALRRIFNNRVFSGDIDLSEINIPDNINKIQIVACGTAYHSGLIGKYVIEELARIKVEVDIASEFRYRNPLIDENTLVIVVSQSGETADTLAGLRLAQEKGAKVLALSNVVGSSIPREADEVLYLKAGPEIAVASTKAYITMLAAFYLLGIFFARKRNILSSQLEKELIDDLLRLPDLAAKIIDESEDIIKEIAREFKDHDNSFFIGRNTDYTLALEGALKLKEISYIHAEAYAAGELKHGTLALIEEAVPVVAIATREDVFEKMLSNIKEVKARGANVLALAFQEAEGIIQAVDEIIFIPEIHGVFSGVLTIIPLQLLAYYVALERNCDIDQPRNLAKSVTVE